MVTLGVPEPPHESPLDEIQASDEIVIPGTDTSDTEDEDMQYNGYEPLPLGPMEVGNEDSSDEELDSQFTNALPMASDSLPEIDPMEKALVKEVWSGPMPPCVDIEMDSNKENEVKQAMANFTLPSTSIPEWAVNIPEDQWKEQLISRIQSLQDSKIKK